MLKFCVKVFFLCDGRSTGRLAVLYEDRSCIVYFSSAVPFIPIFQYSILMYVTKQQPVTNVKITPAFVYTVSINFLY